MNHRMSVGRWGEDITASVLEHHGYSLIERNWRPTPVPGIETVRGEVDLVMLDPDNCLVFIEVKTRSSSDFGHPFEAINSDKAKRLKFLAYSWCSEQESTDFSTMRIDAVAITGDAENFTFEHLRGALAS